MPIARARFERTMATARTSASATTPISPRVRRTFGVFGGVLALPRPALSAAAIALVALAALLAYTLVGSPGGGSETAYAAVLDPGDYVEVGGVVVEAQDTRSGRRLTLETAAGKLHIEVATTGTVLDAGGGEGRPVSSIQPGDALNIGGIVGADRSVSADALKRSATGAPVPAPGQFRELRQLGGELTGRVVSVALSPDGRRAHVFIDGGPGQRVFVNVDRASAEQLLTRAETVGARVQVVQAPGQPGGPFTLTFPGADVQPTTPAGAATPAPGAGQPELPRLSGHVTARSGDRLEVTLLATADGRARTVTVVIEPRTRIFVNPQGPTEAAIRDGTAPLVGVLVGVTGPRDRDGVVHAAVLIVGRAAQ